MFAKSECNEGAHGARPASPLTNRYYYTPMVLQIKLLFLTMNVAKNDMKLISRIRNDMAEEVRRSPPTGAVPSSHLGHSM